MDKSIFDYLDTPLFKVIFIAIITILLVKLFRRLSKRGDTQQSLYKRFFFNIIIAIVYIAGIMMAIGQIPQLSKLTQTLLAGSGILALAVSLSAQESLGNVINGLFITVFKPFEVGDRVKLVNSNITGTIEDITLRHTVIKTFMNSRVVIPNSTINKEIIENSNLIDSRACAPVDISISYESDVDMAMEIMSQVIGDHPMYIDTRSEAEIDTKPKVQVLIRELGASAIMLRASMWTQTVSENFQACSDVRLDIKKAFDAAGIEIPYNKLTISNLKDIDIK